MHVPTAKDKKHRGERDAKVQPGRDQHAAEHVPSHLIGAENVQRAGPLQDTREIDRVRIVGDQPRCSHSDGDQQPR